MANFIVTTGDTQYPYPIDTGIDATKINSIPGLAQFLQQSYQNLPVGNYANSQIKSIAQKVVADPLTFEKNQFVNSVKAYGYDASTGNFAGQQDQSVINNAKNTAIQQAQYLASQGVSPSEIQSLLQQGESAAASAVKQTQADIQKTIDIGTGGSFLNNVFSIGLALALPEVGAAIGASLLDAGILAAGTSTATATAVGTALASTASQIAQGADPTTAIKNAAINSIVQTGSNDAAKALLKNTDFSVSTANALASAGGSIASTLAKGGNATTAIKNAIGGAIGSEVGSEYGSAAGSAAGTLAATGNVTSALISGASQLGNTATTTPKTTSDAGPAASTTPEANATTSSVGAANVTPATESPDLGTITVTAPKANATIVSPTVTNNAQSTTYIPSNIPNNFGEIITTAPKLPPATIVSPDVSGNASTSSPTANLGTVTATAPKLPTATTSETPTAETQPSQSGYINIQSGIPTALANVIGTNLAPYYYPSSGTTSGLTGGALGGEIQSGETGGKRQNVWDEASLRLKDALGL